MQLQSQSVGGNQKKILSTIYIYIYWAQNLKCKAIAKWGDSPRTYDAHHNCSFMKHGIFFELCRFDMLAIFALFSRVGAWERHG